MSGGENLWETKSRFEEIIQHRAKYARGESTYSDNGQSYSHLHNLLEESTPEVVEKIAQLHDLGLYHLW
jgi:hypothetical protein